ncbi:MAG: hypothetical protein ACE5G0_01665 [Rhodothermales bacterium]
MLHVVKKHHRPLFGLLALFALGYVAIAAYFACWLEYDFLQADTEIISYWQDSLGWRQPFHPFHVPGYPLMIALVRGLTLGTLPPIAVMMGINLGALLWSVLLVYRILRSHPIPDRYALAGAGLFGLWPFVGLVYSVRPLADLPALALLLAGLHALQRRRLIGAGFFLGLSLVTHKALWPFAALLVAAEVFRGPRRFSRHHAAALLLLILPLGLLWFFGTLHHDSATWLIAGNLKAEIAPRGTFPVLDGVIGTLREGGLKALVKGGTVIGVGVLSAYLLYTCTRFKPRYFQYGLALSASVLVLFLLLNEHEIWAVVRFGRLLVVPWMGYLGARYSAERPSRLSAVVLLLSLGVLVLSQFAFAWYMTQ